jgi:hypothetical protein
MEKLRKYSSPRRGSRTKRRSRILQFAAGTFAALHGNTQPSLMTCPVCGKSAKDFRTHVLNHVRLDEAYAVEVWNPKKFVSSLTVYPLQRPLTVGELKTLRKELNGPNRTVIYGRRLRLMERVSTKGG